MRRFLLLILMMYVVPSVSFAAPIHDAAKAGDVAAITAALDAGADIKGIDGGVTPLFFTAIPGAPGSGEASHRARCRCQCQDEIRFTPDGSCGERGT